MWIMKFILLHREFCEIYNCLAFQKRYAAVEHEHGPYAVVQQFADSTVETEEMRMRQSGSAGVLEAFYGLMQPYRDIYGGKSVGENNSFGFMYHTQNIKDINVTHQQPESCSLRCQAALVSHSVR